MNVPAPPALPAVGWEGVGIASPAVGRELSRTESLTGTTTATIARLAIRSSSLDVLQGHAVTVNGRLGARHTLAGLAGRMVTLQALRGNGWSTLAVARTSARGSFRLHFTPHRIGSERVRVRFAGDQYLLAARRQLGRLNVYRAVEVSWYGGGGGLACGGSLTSGTMGVASRTLPCGTLVTLRFGGRSVRVPVVDRGPFVAGREFDLTEATKQALGFGDTGALWSTS
jgi:rare lipoprotein A